MSDSKGALLARTARIAGHVLKEKATRPKAEAASDVPRGPDGFTNEWLTAVLCRDVPGAAVTGFSLAETSVGTTSRGRLELSYNAAGRDAQLPASVWFKTSPTFTSRLVTGLTGVSRVEGLFYTRVRPGLDLMAPAGYHGAFDEGSCRSVVLIEDIGRTRGATFAGPADRHVTEAMAASMVREMASYHGAFWNSPRLERDLDWAPTSLGFQERTNAAINFEKRTLIGVDRCADVSAPGFTARKREVWPAAMQSLRMNVAGPQTLLHQDTHAGNWYVSRDGEMGLYDWQCVARGGWALDFAYALMSNLTVEDRRAWERDLVERYVALLRDAGVDAPSPEEAWLQYRQQTFHGLIFWLYTIGAGRLQPDMQPVEISKANLERMTAAVMDLDSFGALTSAHAPSWSAVTSRSARSS